MLINYHCHFRRFLLPHLHSGPRHLGEPHNNDKSLAYMLWLSRILSPTTYHYPTSPRRIHMNKVDCDSNIQHSRSRMPRSAYNYAFSDAGNNNRLTLACVYRIVSTYSTQSCRHYSFCMSYRSHLCLPDKLQKIWQTESFLTQHSLLFFTLYAPERCLILLLFFKSVQNCL
jgi:hypothetical protein